MLSASLNKTFLSLYYFMVAATCKVGCVHGQLQYDTCTCNCEANWSGHECDIGRFTVICNGM